MGPMSTDSGSEETSLGAFRDLYDGDREGQGVRPLSEYLARFPGDEDSIAREYLTLK